MKFNKWNLIKFLRKIKFNKLKKKLKKPIIQTNKCRKFKFKMKIMKKILTLLSMKILIKILTKLLKKKIIPIK